MNDEAPQAESADTLPPLDEAATRFVEELALFWEGTNAQRMEGRIVGLLMILDVPYLSSTQIATLLKASAGAVSTSTRRLVEVGFIKRHMIPGDRNHYFRVEDDIWGSFLAGERAYLVRLRDALDTGFSMPAALAEGPARRLTNARNYMEWLAGYHRKMLLDWEVYRDEMAGLAGPGGAPAPGSTQDTHDPDPQGEP